MLGFRATSPLWQGRKRLQHQLKYSEPTTCSSSLKNQLTAAFVADFSWECATKATLIQILIWWAYAFR